MFGEGMRIGMERGCMRSRRQMCVGRERMHVGRREVRIAHIGVADIAVAYISVADIAATGAVEMARRRVRMERGPRKMRSCTCAAEMWSGVSTEMWRAEMRSATARMATAAWVAATTAGVSSPTTWVSTAAATGSGKRCPCSGC